MSELHARQLEAHVRGLFSGQIDLSDVASRPEAEQDNMFLSRALALYGLGLIARSSCGAPNVVDGFDDNGIDAILPDRGSHRLCLVQSKWIRAGRGEPGSGDVGKFVNGVKDLIDCRFARFNSKLQKWQQDVGDLLLDPHLEIHLLLVFTGDSFGNHSERLIDDLKVQYNDVSELIHFHLVRLKELHRSLVADIRGETIDCDLVLHSWGMIEDQPPAYYGYIVASDFHSLWQTNGAALFAENLRSFMPSTDVNAAIQKTLQTSPDRFFYLNNGVTILARLAKRKPMGAGDNKIGIFACEKISIINGAQTVGCIGTVPPSAISSLARVKVLCKIISVGEAEESFAETVTRGCNTQNTILPKDFAALDEQQRRLDIDFRLMGKRYVYRSGEQPPLPAEGLTLEEAAIALACRNPDTAFATLAKREVGKLWEDSKKKPYIDLFNNTVTADELWKLVNFMRAVDSLLIDRLLESNLDNLSYAIHGNRFLLHLMFQHFAAELSTINPSQPDTSERIKEAIELALANTATERTRLYPEGYLQSLFKNQSKTKELARAVLANLVVPSA